MCKEQDHSVVNKITSVTNGHQFYEIMWSCLTKEVCTQYKLTNLEQPEWIAAGCLRAGEDENTGCHGNSSGSPIQLNRRASGDCQSVIRDDALIGSLMELSDESPETFPHHANLPPDSWHFTFFFHAEEGGYFSWMKGPRHTKRAGICWTDRLDCTETATCIIMKRLFIQSVILETFSAALWEQFFFSCFVWIHSAVTFTLHVTTCE